MVGTEELGHPIRQALLRADVRDDPKEEQLYGALANQLAVGPESSGSLTLSQLEAWDLQGRGDCHQDNKHHQECPVELDPDELLLRRPRLIHQLRENQRA